MWKQVEITLTSRNRGFHLITDELLEQLPDIAAIEIGLAHFFLQHTSASLSLNENADVSVRSDMESHFNVLAPENMPYYLHLYEGADDMPAHIKSALCGVDVTIPIRAGKLVLGTWQGIYLGEHRNSGGCRRVMVTLQGQTL
jgi:secondary thiamine-phosphate synthase enzyme